MNSHKLFLLLIVMAFISSCIPLGEVRYRFKFVNSSEKDVYIVINTNTDDECISSGSIYDYVYANNWKYIENKKTWAEVIKDDAYVYVLDASLINLLPLEGYLTEEKRSSITNEMILGRIIVHHDDFSTMFTLSYPLD